MSGLSLDSAKEAKDEASSDRLRENDAGIPDEDAIDWENATGYEDVKLHPETLVVFDHVARISIQTYGEDGNILEMEQNLDGAGRYGFDIELTVANPTIVDGQLWEEADAEYPNYKIVGDPASDENPYELRESVVREDGEVVGSEVDGISSLPGGQSFDGQPVEDVDAEYMQFTISGSRGTDVLGVLDTAGAWFTDADGNVREGLFEVPPSFGTDAYDASEDPSPRLTGYPELRSDMVSQRGAIACVYDIDDPTEADTRTGINLDVFSVDGEEMSMLMSLTPESEAYAKPTYPRVNNTVWTDSDSGADAQPQTEGGVASAQEAITGNNELTYDDLSEDGQLFVDDAVDALDVADFGTVDGFADPDWAARVEDHAQRTDMTDDAEALALVTENQL